VTGRARAIVGFKSIHTGYQLLEGTLVRKIRQHDRVETKTQRGDVIDRADAAPTRTIAPRVAGGFMPVASKI